MALSPHQTNFSTSLRYCQCIAKIRAVALSAGEIVLEGKDSTRVPQSELRPMPAHM
jgi:hypothetical protein